MVNPGMISVDDLDFCTPVETAEAAWNTIRDYYG
jgi:hypothetical protein